MRQLVREDRVYEQSIELPVVHAKQLQLLCVFVHSYFSLP